MDEDAHLHHHHHNHRPLQLLDLCNEVLELIFSVHLPWIDRPLARFVCRRVNEVVYTGSGRWGKLARSVVDRLARELAREGVNPARRESAAARIVAAISRGCPWKARNASWPFRVSGRLRGDAADRTSPRDMRLHWIGMAVDPDADVGRLLAFEDVLAYKVVNFRVRRDVGMLSRMDGVVALLTLQVPADASCIYDIEGEGHMCAPRDLQRRRKYCASVARVLGVRFFGKASVVRLALAAFQLGRGSLTSAYDPDFEYALGEDAIEPEAGRGCTRNVCGSGIYFFVDEPSAMAWAGIQDHHYGDWQGKTMVVTGRLSEMRGLVMRPPDFPAGLRARGAEEEEEGGYVGWVPQPVGWMRDAWGKIKSTLTLTPLESPIEAERRKRREALQAWLSETRGDLVLEGEEGGDEEDDDSESQQDGDEEEKEKENHDGSDGEGTNARKRRPFVLDVARILDAFPRANVLSPLEEGGIGP
jgi:hypothetical protein